MKHLKHYRVPKGTNVSPFGGLTCVTERTPEGFRTGVALCSDKDNFCKKTGRELAYERFEHKYLAIHDRQVVDCLLKETPALVHKVVALLAAKAL